MKALVTGGGGFLGQYIVEQLVARGDQVRSLSRKIYPALDALGVEQTAGDIQDGNIVDSACTNIDVVFHTAAIAGIWGDPKRFLASTCTARRISFLPAENTTCKNWFSVAARV